MLPLDYLHAIEHASLPLEETDPAKIKCIELLRAVGYLDATITPLASQGNKARVAKITWTGRMALGNHKFRSAQSGTTE